MPPEDGGGPALGRIVELGLQVLAPVTALTGVLYYFGYIRYQEFFAHFGVDLTSAGITRAGFVVGSARVAFGPLAAALLVALAALAGHYALTPRLTRAGGRPLAALGACALVLAAVAGAGLVGLPLGTALLPPAALIGAALLAGYLSHLAGRRGVPEPLRETFDRTRTARIVLLTATLTVAVFWAVSTYARERGREAAEAFERSLPLQARAVVYSRERLFITGPGVEVQQLTGPGAKYGYRYSGLRVLTHTADRWLLVPPVWDPGTSTVVVLPDMAEEIRVDLAP
ncbi:hypothetical protein Ade02nite_96490 [Paractinoplanes deccanensis]|uniref:DUF5671 domain-containing protein n=1 Tax=Paractinoplanes deccanensis TaxID=113561 RepID=A0ABQ3YLY8_9ACTN|nr:hypothetical protein [Actinoplanes deccanensis]GID81008.1 hypothetical protein Ade02nite_96490 [Actinoplanes deccanensis]